MNRDRLYQLETLEPRLLLSADPVLGLHGKDLFEATEVDAVVVEDQQPLAAELEADPSESDGIFEVPDQPIEAEAETDPVNEAEVVAVAERSHESGPIENDLSLYVTQSSGGNDPVEHLVTTLDTGQAPPIEGYALLALNDSQSADNEVYAQLADPPSVPRPMLVLPGIAGSFASPGAEEIWYTTRGILPEFLEIDPLKGFYNDILATFENAAGYELNKTLFAAAYDWRLAPGPAPDGQVYDGHVSGITGSSITDDRYEFGVDYLGYWLERAASEWEKLTGSRPTHVDIVTHSTGGLVARTYIQSDAYGAVNSDGDTLPRVENLVMAGVPNRGAPKPWSTLHDDSSIDPAFRIVLSKLINKAYNYYMDGEVITGEDGNLKKPENGTPLTHDQFIAAYVPTVQALLATYDFLFDDANNLTDTNDDPLANHWVLDLNDGLDKDYTLEEFNNGTGGAVGRDPNKFLDAIGHTWIYYADGTYELPDGVSISGPSTLETISTYRKQTGPSGDQLVVNFDEFYGHTPEADEVWYQYNKLPNAGDGTVPTESSAFQFFADPDYTPQPGVAHFSVILVNQPTVDGNTTELSTMDHTGMMGNLQFQQDLLTRLALPNADFSKISTTRSLGMEDTLLKVYDLQILDPNDFLESVDWTAISNFSPEQEIRNGLVKLGDLYGSIEEVASEQVRKPLQYEVPFTNQTFGQLLDINSLYKDHFVGPIASFMQNPGTSTDDLVNWIKGSLESAASLGGINLQIDGDLVRGGVMDLSDSRIQTILELDTSPAGQINEVVFTIPFKLSRVSDVSVNLGALAKLKGYEAGLDATLSFTAELAGTLVFGYDMRPNIASSNRFFIRMTQFEAGVFADVDQFSSSMTIGSLGASIENASLNASAGLQFGFAESVKNSRENITLSKIVQYTNNWDGIMRLSSAFRPYATLNGVLPVKATLGDKTVENGSIEISGTNLFKRNPTITTSGFDFLSFSSQQSLQSTVAATTSTDLGNLNDFATVGLNAYEEVFNALTSIFQRSQDSPELQADIPFAEDLPLGSLLDLSTVLDEGLINHLKTEEGTLAYSNLQEFITLVNTLMEQSFGGFAPEDRPSGLNTEGFYDPVNETLGFRFDFGFGFAASDQNFSLDYDLEPLEIFINGGKFELSGLGTLGFDLLFDLSDPVAEVIADQALPADGILAEPVSLEIYLNGGLLPTGLPLVVEIAPDPTNTSAADLVDDINAAIQASPIGDLLNARLLGGDLLVLETTYGGPSPSILLDNGQGIGFSDTTYSGNTVTTRVSVSNLNSSLSANLSAARFTAGARLGYLGIFINEGSANLDLTIDAEFTRTGSRNLHEFFMAIGADPTTLLPNVTVSGTGGILLSGITVEGGFTQDPLATASIEIRLSASASFPVAADDPAQFEVIFNGDFSELLKFEQLTFQDVIQLLRSGLNTIESIVQSDFLNTPIPFVGGSINDVLATVDELARFIDELEQRGPATIQSFAALMTASLQDLLDENLPGENLSATALIEFGNDDLLRIDFSFLAAITLQERFELDALGGLGLANVIDLQANTLLEISLAAWINFAMGIDLSNPVSPVAYLLDGTDAVFEILLAAEGINFGAAAPLVLYIREGSINIDDGTPEKGPARGTFSFAPDGTDRREISTVSLTDFTATIVGEARANLPVYFPTEADPLNPAITFHVDFQDLGNPTVTGPDFSTLFTDLNLFDSLGDGLELLFIALKEVADGDIFGFEIPFIGDQIADAATFLLKLREKVGPALDNITDATEAEVQQLLFDALGPAGIGFLLPQQRSGSGLPTGLETATKDDIRVDLTSSNQLVDNIEIEMRLGQLIDLLDAGIDFDIGLPGLNLEFDTDMLIELAWEWRLIFGINRAEGFYIQTVDNEELQIQLDVSFPDTQLTGSLGFIGLSAIENPGNSTTGLNMSAKVDFNTAATDRITLANLTSGLSNFDVRLDGSAVMDLILTVGFADLSGEPVDALPSFLVDFFFQWDFADSSTIGSERGSKPTVQFNNIRIDVGTFFSDFLRPIVDTINAYLEPLRPVIDLLSQDLAVISWGPFENFFDQNNDGDVTLVDLAVIFGTVNPTAQSFIDAAIFIIDLVEDLSGSGVPGRDSNLTISLGDFDFGSVDLRNQDFASIDPLNGLFTDPAMSVDEAFAEIGGAADSIYSSTQNSANVGDGLFQFELFDAANVVKLLMGQPVDFFSYRLPEISIQFGFGVSIPVPVLPINVNFGAYAGFDASLTFGYDSSGIMAYLAEDGEPSDLFGGFHIRVGQEVPPQLTMYGRVFGGASLVVRVLGVTVTEIGVEVGIGLEASFSLIDPGQGKLYFWQISSLVEKQGLLPAIECLFIVEGELYAFGKFFAKVLGATVWSDEFARVTLVELGPGENEPPCFVYLIPDRLEMHETGLPNNDTLAFAADIGAAPGIHLRGASISSEGDVDYYKFELLRADSVDIVLDGHKEFEISLFDADGLLVAVAPAGIDRKTIRTSMLPKGSYFLKIKSADAEIYDAYDLDINPGPASTTRVFYINDAIPDTALHDFYALAPGSDDYEQAGADPSTPAASLAKILENYTLTEDDMVLFDTGEYLDGFSIGSDTSGFLVSGAPNDLWRELPETTVFGSVLSSDTADPVVSVSDVANVSLAKFRFADSTTGLSIQNSQGFKGIDLEFENLDTAVSMSGSDAAEFDRINLAGPSQTTGIGLLISDSTGLVITDSEFSTVNQGVVLSNVSEASLQAIISSEVNNLVIADGGSGLDLKTFDIEGAKVVKTPEGQNVYIGDGETAIQISNMSNVTLDNVDIAHYKTGVEMSGLNTVGIVGLETDRTNTGLRGTSLVDTSIDGSNLRGSVSPLSVGTDPAIGPGQNFTITNSTIGDYFTDDVDGPSQGNSSTIAGVSTLTGSGNSHFGKLTIAASDTVSWQGSNIQRGAISVENSSNVTVSGNIFEASVEADFPMLGFVNVSTGTIQDNTLTGSGDGILVESSQTITIFDNTINETGTGLSISGSTTSLSSGVEVYQNSFTTGFTGIFVENNFVEAIDIHDNLLSDFGGTGIRAVGYAALTGNTVENSGVGFRVENDQPGMWLNVSRDNSIGVTGTGYLGNDDRSADKYNVIYNNTIGIVAEGGGQTVAFNQVYGNLFGISIEGESLVRHNVVYENTSIDVRINGADGSSLWNNTIYSTGEAAVRLEADSSNTDIRNNIVWSVGGTALDVEFPSGDNLESDYNTWYVSGGGTLFKWIKTFDDILDWQIELGLDLNSLGTTRLDPTLDQPNFVNQPAADFTIIDGVSNSINSGDPSFSFDNESGPNAGPNGLRINQGAYGDTAKAALSPESYIRVLSPNYYLDYTRELARRVIWEHFNVTGNVSLELIEDGVGKAADITIVTVDNQPEQVFEQPASHGSYFWSPQMSGIAGDNAKRYFIRVISAGDATIQDDNREPFSIPETTNQYYVNDLSPSGDVLTTAIGDNRYTGKTAATPKAILPAILQNYALSANQTVYVDAGNYLHLRDILVSSEDEFGNNEAFTLEGPAGDATAVSFDRADPREGSAGLIFDNASFVTLRNISLTGGYKGIEARNNSTFLTFENILLDGHTGIQMHLYGGADRAVINNVRLLNGGGQGLVVNGLLQSFTNSVVDNHGDLGVSLVDTGNTIVEGNSISRNAGGGIYVYNRAATTQTLIGNEDLSLGRGNVFHDNGGNQVEVRGLVLLVGNSIFHTDGESTSGNGTGVYTWTVPVRNNVIAGHATGVYSYQGATIEENRIYNNRLRGIALNGYDPETVARNVIYSTAIGIEEVRGQSNGGNFFRNNLIYDFETAALSTSSTGGFVFENNTVYSATGDGVIIRSSGGGTIVNNIFHLEAGIALNLDVSSQNNLTSDFNIFDLTGTAKVGTWAGGTRATLQDWRNASFLDDVSLAVDPLFVDVDGADGLLGYSSVTEDGRDDNFHLQSVVGSVRNGSLVPVMDAGTQLPVFPLTTRVADAAQSPAIDRGDAAYAFDLEPATNGNFINIGAFGNTELASLSPAAYVLVMFPTGGETFPIEQTFAIEWRSQNFDGTVDILLRQEGVVDPVATIATATENDGVYEWALTNALAPDTNYRIEVVRGDAPEVSGQSLGLFAISDPISFYYVNDSVVDIGGYTTAAGDNGFNGLSPATPKASIRAILDTYDLGEGDVILVDAGNYDVTTNIFIEVQDSGVTIRGFIDPSRPELLTVLDRGNRADGAYVFELTGVSDLTIERITFTNADRGIYAGEGQAPNLTIRESRFMFNEDAGILVGGLNAGFLVEGNYFEGSGNYSNGQGRQDTGIYYSGTGGVIRGNEFLSNYSEGIYIDTVYTTEPVSYLVEGNTVSGSRTGIRMGARVADALIRENTVFANSDEGIHARGARTIVTDNVAYDNNIGILVWSGATAIANAEIYNNTYGILVRSGAYAIDNIVHDNTQGIRGENAVRIEGNLAYTNGTGIVWNHSTLVVGNTAYDNTIGLHANGYIGSNSQWRASMFNNLSYGNVETAFKVDRTVGSPEVYNNTFVQNGPDGVAVLIVDAPRLQFFNNIVSVDSGLAMSINSASQAGFVADYNVYHLVNGASAFLWGDLSLNTQLDWFYNVSADAHSVFADPLFVDPSNADYHLSTASPAIDMGDPDSIFLLEPVPSGHRINVGAYGNTTQAAVNDAQSVQVLNPVFLDKLLQGTQTNIDFLGSGFLNQQTVAWFNTGFGSYDRWIELPDRSSVERDSITSSIDLSQVTDPAPLDVYRNSWRTDFGVGKSMDISFDLQPGDYLLRLHFVDTASNASEIFDLELNGDLVLDDYSIYAAAGGRFIAVVEELPVTVGPDGEVAITITSGDRYGRISGIEVRRVNASGTAVPTYTVEASYDGGSNYFAVATGVTTDSRGFGSVAWTPSQSTQGRTALIRVTSEDVLSVSGTSDAFLVANSGTSYYINDGFLENDVYTTAIGDNANSGKDPSAPMASLEALLTVYSPSPGDTIYIDSGTYNLTRNIVLTASESGISLVGAVDEGNANAETIFDRGNRSSPAYGIEFAGASEVTIKDLTITNAYRGIFADVGNAPNLTILNSRFLMNEDAGIYVNRENPNLLVEDSYFEGSDVYNNGDQDEGIFYGGLTAVIRNNVFVNNYRSGLDISSPSSNAEMNYLVEGNIVSGSYSGILMDGWVNDALVRNNTVFNNSDSGIHVAGWRSVVTQNIAYDNLHGIEVRGGATAIENTEIYNNVIGILVTSNADARYNVVYNNSEGIRSIASSYNSPNELEGNVAYDNNIGFRYNNRTYVFGNTAYNNGGGFFGEYLSSNGWWRGIMYNNLAYGNTDYALKLERNSGVPKVYNNTFVQAGAGSTAVIIDQAANVLFHSNIISVDGAAALNVSANSQAGFDADYNVYDLQNITDAFVWGDRIYSNQADWFYSTSMDKHSTFADASFVDPASGDYHLLAGSPAIDAGNPEWGYAFEPGPSGGRLNAGAYGNTTDATVSPDKTIAILDPTFLDKPLQNGETTVRFQTSGFLDRQAVAWFNAGDSYIEGWVPMPGQSGGDARDRQVAVDTSGVNNPAPQQVYREYLDSGYRSRIDVPLSLQPGDYVLRLHFALITGGTSYPFNIEVDGELVRENYNINAAAGGAQKAVVEEVNVTVGQDGEVTVSFIAIDYYAYISAIEVVRVYEGRTADPRFSLEASFDNGANYSGVASGVAIDLRGFGSATWTPVVSTEGREAVLRVTSETTDPVSGLSEPLLVANDGTRYYVNDGSIENDIFTSAIGDNLNSGKDPDSPMASLEALFAVHTPVAGDVVYVDSGTYLMTKNVVLTAANSGVTILGALAPDNGATETVLDRTNRGASSYVIEIAGANDVTLDSLTITNAHRGVMVYENQGHDLTIRNSRIIFNQDAGVFVDRYNPGLLVEDSYFEGKTAYNTAGMQEQGIEVYATNLVIRNSTFVNHYRNGLNIGNSFEDNPQALIENSHFEGGSSGNGIANINESNTTIIGSTFANSRYDGLYLNAGGSVVRDSVAYGNGDWGFNIRGGSTAENNIAYGNSLGMYGYTGTKLLNNLVFDNNRGMYLYQRALAEGNRVYGNSSYGIAGGFDPRIINNQVYSNGVGIIADYNDNRFAFTGTIANNLVYSNDSIGIHVEQGSGNFSLHNNTIYHQTGDALLIQRVSGGHITNNIIRVDAGFAINITSDILGNDFLLDYNLFFLSEDPNARIGVVDETFTNTLEDWRAATGRDANSLFGDPLFFDMDGADDVLGYRELDGILIDAGEDDNFHLLKLSPAIDRGYTWWNFDTDKDGDPRQDDPGVFNSGSDRYDIFVSDENLFDADRGVAQGWTNRFSRYTVDLPFTFNWYENDLTQIQVSPFGIVGFPEAFVNPHIFEENKFTGNSVLTPFWGDVDTEGGNGRDIYVDTSVAGEVYIRWEGRNRVDGTPVRFAVLLSEDGTIRIDYGEGNLNLNPYVGLSLGNGNDYQFVPGYNGASDLSNSNSVFISRIPGIEDIGAYEFKGNSLDDEAPATIGTLPAEIENGLEFFGFLEELIIQVSEAVDSIDVLSPATYELIRDADGDGLFTNADVFYELTPVYDPDSNSVTLQIEGGALEDGDYQFRIRAGNLRDVSGNLLDGDGDGAAGGDYLRAFSVRQPVLPEFTNASELTTVAGEAFTFQITALNDPTTFDATGLPEGLSVSETSGLISGTPTVFGEFELSLSATNSEGTSEMILTLTVLPVPQIVDVLINEGDSDRSMITRIDIEVDNDVSASLNASDFQFFNKTTGEFLDTPFVQVNWSFTTQVISLSFPGLPGGSLPDGDYVLSIASGAIEADGVALDGDGDSAQGGVYELAFHRLFGDVTANRSVDILDGWNLRRAYGSTIEDANYDSDFDSDTNGLINLADRNAFEQNFLTSLAADPVQPQANLITSSVLSTPIMDTDSAFSLHFWDPTRLYLSEGRLFSYSSIATTGASSFSLFDSTVLDETARLWLLPVTTSANIILLF